MALGAVHLGVGPHVGPEAIALPLATTYVFLTTVVAVAGTLPVHAATLTTVVPR